MSKVAIATASENWKDFVWEKQLPPSHALLVFHANPCKLRNFQTVVKYFLIITRLKSHFLFVTGNKLEPLNA